MQACILGAGQLGGAAVQHRWSLQPTNTHLSSVAPQQTGRDRTAGADTLDGAVSQAYDIAMHSGEETALQLRSLQGVEQHACKAGERPHLSSVSCLMLCPACLILLSTIAAADCTVPYFTNSN